MSAKFSKVLSDLNKDRNFIVLCALIGLIGGALAVAFHLSITYLFKWIWFVGGLCGEEYRVFLMPLFPFLAGAFVGICVGNFAKSASGGGIPQTKRVFFNDFGIFKLKDIIYRFIFSSVFIGFGNSAGREGPTVHLCAALSSVMAQKLGLSKNRVRDVVPVGIGAGISASFNAPLSAVSFVFEEFFGGFSNVKGAGGIFIAVAVAAAVSRILIGENPVLAIANIEFHTGWWMLVCLPIAILSGVFGHLFLEGILRLRKACLKFAKVPRWIWTALGGLVVGILATLAYSWSDGYDSVFSIGYNVLLPAFDANVTLKAMFIIFVFKFICTLINYATGGSGGIFSGTIVIGGMLGGTIGALFCIALGLNSSVIGASLMMGIGACLASIVRCPITSILMIFELTLNYSLIIPIIFGNLIAYFISTRLSTMGLYDAILLQDKVSLKKLPSFRGNRDWTRLPVSAIMTFSVKGVKASQKVKDAKIEIEKSEHTYRVYAVFDDDGGFAGFAKREDILNPKNSDLICAEIISSKAVYLTPDVSITKAANFLIEKDILEVAIVDEFSPEKLLGILTLHDIARQQNASENLEL